MATATLTPNNTPFATSTGTSGVGDAGAPSVLNTQVDDTPIDGSVNTSDRWEFLLNTSPQTVTRTPVSSTPSDFASANTGAGKIKLRICYDVIGGSDDTTSLTVSLAIGTSPFTLMADSAQIFSVTTGWGTPQFAEFTLTLNSTGLSNNNKTTWDDMTVTLQGSRGSVMGADSGRTIYVYAWDIQLIDYVSSSTDATVPASTVSAAASVPAPSIRRHHTVPAAVVAATATVGVVDVKRPAAPAVVAVSASVPAPTLSSGSRASPPVVAVTATVPAPAAQASAQPAPPVVAVTATVGAPTIAASSTATPSVVAIAASIGTPIVSSSSVVPAVVVPAVATVGVPTIPTGSDATVPATVVPVAATVGVPAAQGGAVATPPVVAAVATVPATTETASSLVPAVVVPVAATVPAPTPQGGAVATPPVIAVPVTLPPPTESASSSVPAVVVPVTATVPPPTETAGSLVPAVNVAGVATVGAPTLQAGAVATPPVVGASAAIGTPVSSSGSTVPAAVVATVSTVPPPAVSGAGGATVPASVVAAVATVGVPTISQGAGVIAQAVAIGVSIGTVTISTGSTATPATVQAVTSIPLPVLQAGSQVLAAVVNVVASVNAVTVAAGARPAPATVQAAATVGVATLQAGSTVLANVVSSVVTIPAPVVSGSGTTHATVTATTVQAVATVGTVVPSAGSKAAPATVGVIVRIGFPNILAFVDLPGADGGRSAYIWDGVSWNRVRMRVDDGVFTGFNAEGYVWDGSSFRQFQPPPDSSLLPPENVQFPYIGDREADITWILPTQPVVEPTDVQFRIPELSTIWTEMSYPTSSYSALGLVPETPYQFQVRLIRRVDGIVVQTSRMAEGFFVTTAPDSPGYPAPDPGGTGSDSIIYWPDIGGTVGGPGCWWEYVVQGLAGDETINDFADLVPEVSGELDGDIGAWQVDPITDLGLDCGELYRLKFREVCDGVPGAWNFGVPFLVTCDWAASCGGITQSPSLTDPIMDDASWAIPKVCTDPTIGLHIEEAIYGTQMTIMPGMAAPLNDTEDEWCLLARDFDTGFEPLLTGPLNQIQGWDSTQDFTTSVRLRLREMPTAGAQIQKLANTVMLLVAQSGAGFVAQVLAPREGGGAPILLTSTTELAFNDTHRITFRCDADGDKDLWVNGSLEDSDTTGDGINMDNANLNITISSPPNGDVSNIYGWERLLTDAEISSFDPFPFDISEPWVSGLGDAAAQAYYSLAWSPELGIAVALGQNRAAYSYDGWHWYSTTAPNGLFAHTMWIPELGLFVTCNNSDQASDPTNPLVYYSEDGITWQSDDTVENPPLSASGQIAWSPELGRVVIGCTGGLPFNNFSIISSEDGKEWTTRTNAIPFAEAGAWSPELGLFAYARNASTGCHSTDGINWNSHSNSCNNPDSMTWSPDRGRFVVTQSGTGSTVRTSDNGTTWTARTVPGGAAGWRGIIWNDIYKKFQMVGRSGSVSFGESSDGITWTTSNATLGAGQWRDLVYIPELEVWVACRSDGGLKVWGKPPAVGGPVTQLGNGYALTRASTILPLAGFDLFAVTAHGTGTSSGTGGRFLVLDFSDPSNPVLVGQSDIDMAVQYVTDMTRVGNLVICCSESNGMSIWDVSDPSTPTKLHTFSGGFIVSIEMLDSQHLVGANRIDDRVRIWDISTPTSPVQKGTYTDATNIDSATALQIIGSYCSVISPSAAARRITTLNLSNVNNPSFADTYQGTAGFTSDWCPAFFDGEWAYVYVAGDAGILRVTAIDVADPTNISLVAAMDFPEFVGTFFPDLIIKMGNTLLVFDSQTVITLDATDPSDMRYLDDHNITYYTSGVVGKQNVGACRLGLNKFITCGLDRVQVYQLGF